MLMNAIVNAVAAEKAEATHAADARSADDVDLGRTLHVLLAEDNKVNQKFAVRALQKEGHTVVVANNGREAVEAWQREKFDVVLMDVQMPEMDGLEATARIIELERAGERDGHTPIVAMTANAMKGDRARCLEAGMDGYISKPGSEVHAVRGDGADARGLAALSASARPRRVSPTRRTARPSTRASSA
jgi:CheY-like chemotaxis protein